jgi:1-aminocyclopropane-1-carboxylate deaminase
LLKNDWSAQNQSIPLNDKVYNGCSLTVKREDQVDKVVSGNKFRKLRYNLLRAQVTGMHTLFTFGGAYSNHIAAVARAARLTGMRSIGIVRGQELDKNSNATLRYCDLQGMQLHFIDRDSYRKRNEPEIIAHYASDPSRTYLLPEGGTNELAVRGCEEILTRDDHTFDYICVAAGTGGTLAGIVRSARPGQRVIGFSALKGSFLNDSIKRYTPKPYKLTDAYCFGGYGKIDGELVRFVNDFRHRWGILLDPVYTGKMMYGVLDMMRTGAIPAGSSVLTIHTGGLQAVEGTNDYLKKKNLPQIQQ